MDALRPLTFAGSSPHEPWSVCGAIVAKALAPHGYAVTVAHDSNSHRNIPYLLAGRAELGATTPRHLAAARLGTGEHAGDSTAELTAIASIQRPDWLALAIREDLGIRELGEVRERRLPLRIFCGDPGPGGELDLILRHHGFSLEDVLAWGGAHLRWHARPRDFYVREGKVDLILAPVYVGYTPTSHHWFEATVLLGMRFLDFPEPLLETLVRERGYGRGTLPEGLLPGVDRDIPSVTQDTIVIYCRREQPDELVELVARSLDDRSELFKTVRVPLYYDRERVGRRGELPLHRAAERYYRSRGYPV